VSLRDENLRLAVTKAVADVIYGAMAEMRDGHFDVLMAGYEEEGNKQFTVKLPDGTKIATITLVEQKEAFEVGDPVAFLEWMKEHRPDSIETVTQPAWEYCQVTPRSQTAMLKRLDFNNGVVFDRETGEVPDGVAHLPAGRPKGFQVRYEPKGREDAIEAWRSGTLDELMGATDVLRIGR
jgi:hypothetical protein